MNKNESIFKSTTVQIEDVERDDNEELLEENENTIADKVTRLKRKEVITDFLSLYQKKNYANDDISPDFLAQIKKRGITINELYEIMCNNIPGVDPSNHQPSSNVKKGLLDEILTLPNFKKTVKNLGYDWKNKEKLVRPLDAESHIKTAKMLYSFFEETSCKVYIHGSSNSINATLQKKISEDELHNIYTITLSFKNSKHTYAIAELIDNLYQDKCMGVMVGMRIVEIRCNYPVKAKKIYRSLLTIIEDGIYDGYYLF